MPIAEGARYRKQVPSSGRLNQILTGRVSMMRDASLRRGPRRHSAATSCFEAEDLDAAIELASRIPAARLGGAIEVRPVVGR